MTQLTQLEMARMSANTPQSEGSLARRAKASVEAIPIHPRDVKRYLRLSKGVIHLKQSAEDPFALRTMVREHLRLPMEETAIIFKEEEFRPKDALMMEVRRGALWFFSLKSNPNTV